MKSRTVVALTVVGLSLVALVAFAVAKYRAMERHSANIYVATPQIRAAHQQYLLENPTSIFVRFEDLVGPGSYVKQVLVRDGEDYREMFPLRCDTEDYAVTMSDDRRVIWGFGVVQLPDGRLESLGRNHPEAVAAYRRRLTAERRPDGVHTRMLDDFLPEVKGRRFETTYRDGMPHGPFRAFYADGKLWGEATYERGIPVGRHRVYAPNGAVLHDVTFERFQRLPSGQLPPHHWRR